MTLLRPERRKRRLYHLQSLFDDWGIQHFRARELCGLYSEVWPWGDIYPPPTGMQPNIRQTILMADEIRARWGGPVLGVSGFRPTVYNDLLRTADNDHQGSEDSQHLYFRALDLRPVHGPMRDFYDVVEQTALEWHRKGIHVGYGFYDTFCHVDTGRYPHGASPRHWDLR